MTLTPFEEHFEKNPIPEPEKVLVPVKSVMSCPLCKNTSIEITGRCATCKTCGWSLCNG